MNLRRVAELLERLALDGVATPTRAHHWCVEWTAHAAGDAIRRTGVTSAHSISAAVSRGWARVAEWRLVGALWQQATRVQITPCGRQVLERWQQDPAAVAQAEAEPEPEPELDQTPPLPFTLGGVVW